MNNAIPLLVILLLVAPAILVGKKCELHIRKQKPITKLAKGEYPNRGSVEVLNGCGKSGIANKYADYLRKHRFDVKSTGNAVVKNSVAWNYNKTIVVSRSKDMKIAQDVAKLLRCGPPVFIRTDYNESDVTVIIGHNFGEFDNE